LKSKKQRKPLIAPTDDHQELKESSRLSDIIMAEDSVDLPEESKHNTSKRSMQKYLL
jgi:hypothetical protein